MKEFDYNIDLVFDEAHSAGEVIGIGDSQMLRSIRDIREREPDFDKIEELYKTRGVLKGLSTRSGISYEDKIKEVQSQINNALFIPEYVTINIDHPGHYKRMCETGIVINKHTYHFFSCSAGQARNSTVVFVDDEVSEELRRRLNNGRDLNKPLAASKFNAYFGLASSATHIVSEPRFIVVRDFINQATFMANFVTETNWDEDDLVDQREVSLEMNRTDGMGLISPIQSEKWAKELGLDFIPSQWIVRQSFLKGMLCTFPIHQFCEEVNGGCYIVDTIYKDSCGHYIKVDLRDYDVIISESQFKLWDSYASVDSYIENYRSNKLHWGVTQKPSTGGKDILKLNYQFIQTLNLNQRDIDELCEPFSDWLRGVSYDDPWYMLLFLLGINNDRESIYNFLRSSDAYWIKALIVNPDVKDDRFVRQKIRDLMRKRVDAGCMGEIFVNGNFQMLVSDPYAMMQSVCGLPVTGLLKSGETYSNYWNERGVRIVDSMRSPLTYRSEHVLLTLRDDDVAQKWYRYCDLGIILNYYDHHVVNYAGADFDGDILATTDNSAIIRSVYREELPVVYDPPKPDKKLLEQCDLEEAALFGMGSIIGSITNKGSNAYALQPILEDRYGESSDEVNLIISRLRQCCKAQSAQIDKSKIGREVKGIPSAWTQFQKHSEGDSADESERKDFINRTLITRPPYFFRYRYRENKREFDSYRKENEVDCKHRFDRELCDLLGSSDLTGAESEFVANYYKHMPCTWSDSAMNLLCRHIERVKHEIHQRFRTEEFMDGYLAYKSPSHPYTRSHYEDIVDTVKGWNNIIRSRAAVSADRGQDPMDGSLSNLLDDELGKITSDRFEIVNALVDYFYVESPNSNRRLLWYTYGKYIFKNLCDNAKMNPLFPMPDDAGCVEYMGKKYAIEEIKIDDAV